MKLFFRPAVSRTALGVHCRFEYYCGECKQELEDDGYTLFHPPNNLNYQKECQFQGKHFDYPEHTIEATLTEPQPI